MRDRGGNPALSALQRIAPSADSYLDTKAAAVALGVSYWTLVSWRRPGNTSAPSRDALPWFYDRGKVVYRAEDLTRFLQANARELAA